MALSTYSEIKSTVADYLNRADLTAVLPSFVTLAESKFNRELRTRDMLTRVQTTSNDEYVSLPTDFLQHYSLELDAASAQPPMDYIGPQEAKVLKAQNRTASTTYYYTVIDGAFEIIPAPGSDLDLRMVYYAKIPALSDSNTTNWLLTKSPDLYLYSALL